MKHGKQIFGLFFLLLHFPLQNIKSMENFQKLEGKEVLRDALTTWNGTFQLSYKGQGIKVDGKTIAYNLISSVPALGFYRKPYLFRTLCLLVQFDPIALWNFLPPSVQKILEPVRQTSDFSVRGIITVQAISTAADIDAEKSHLVNILYHAWVGELLHEDKNEYRINLPMGIFEYNGIERYTTSKFDLSKDYAQKIGRSFPLPKSAGIAFDKLSALTVYYHSGYSPDNAIFVISADRNLVTFWSVALYENKDALVTFHIVLNNMDMDLKNLICRNVIRNSNTLKNVLTELYDTILPKIANLADKNALRNAIVVIRDLIGGTYPSVSKEPSLYKAHENELLLQSLQNLKKALYQLQKTLIQWIWRKKYLTFEFM